jgi:ferredoxin
MAIPTSRTKVTANILIDIEKCTGCGQCVEVCKDFNFDIVNAKIVKSDKSLFGCIACGHCMMVCPTGAIKIEGRELSPNDLFELPDKKTVPDYQSLLALLQRRRSIREFKDKPVELEKINMILEAAQTAPMGLPPSDVHVLVLENKIVVRKFAEEFSHFLKASDGWLQIGFWH